MGETKDEEVWVSNTRRVVLFTLVLLTSLSLPYFRALNDYNVHPAFISILSGFITMLLTYLPAKYADEKYGLSHALLLGLLVAEFTVYGSPIGFPTPMVISFFFFMFYIGEQEAPDLWPPAYTGKVA